MKMMKIVEAVYDTLSRAGLDSDNECFEDLMMVCSNVAEGHRWQTIDEAFGDLDDRDEYAVAWDIVSFVIGCGCDCSASALLAQAIAAGREALREEAA